MKTLEIKDRQITDNDMFNEHIEIIKTESEFTKWNESDSMACHFKKKFYVKIKMIDPENRGNDYISNDYTTMTIKEANKYIEKINTFPGLFDEMNASYNRCVEFDNDLVDSFIKNLKNEYSENDVKEYLDFLHEVELGYEPISIFLEKK
jgi:hypothetical protein